MGKKQGRRAAWGGVRVYLFFSFSTEVLGGAGEVAPLDCLREGHVSTAFLIAVCALHVTASRSADMVSRSKCLLRHVAK